MQIIIDNAVEKSPRYAAKITSLQNKVLVFSGMNSLLVTINLQNMKLRSLLLALVNLVLFLAVLHEVVDVLVVLVAHATLVRLVAGVRALVRLQSAEGAAHLAALGAGEARHFAAVCVCWVRDELVFGETVLAREPEWACSAQTPMPSACTVT